MERNDESDLDPIETGPEDPSGEPQEKGCATIVFKLLAFGAVAFVVVVGLVFGVCLFG